MSKWLSVPKKSGKHRSNRSIDLFSSDVMVVIVMTFASKTHIIYVAEHIYYLIIVEQKKHNMRR